MIAGFLLTPYGFAVQDCPNTNISYSDAVKKHSQLEFMLTPELANVNESLYKDMQEEYYLLADCIEYWDADAPPGLYKLRTPVECNSSGDVCPNLKCTEDQTIDKLTAHQDFRTNPFNYNHRNTWWYDEEVKRMDVEDEKLHQCLDYFDTRKSNESLAREVGSQLGIDEDDVVKMLGGEEGVKKAYDQNCVIATASFGSPMAKEVQMLREIRDNQLLKTESGSAFMSSFNAFYYSFAPTIAHWEDENPVFKQIVKVTITPLISSLSLLNYVSMDSESEVLTYGISMILLNLGMYFVAPAVVIWQIKKRI